MIIKDHPWFGIWPPRIYRRHNRLEAAIADLIATNDLLLTEVTSLNMQFENRKDVGWGSQYKVASNKITEQMEFWLPGIGALASERKWDIMEKSGWRKTAGTSVWSLSGKAENEKQDNQP